MALGYDSKGASRDAIMVMELNIAIDLIDESHQRDTSKQRVTAVEIAHLKRIPPEAWERLLVRPFKKSGSILTRYEVIRGAKLLRAAHRLGMKHLLCSVWSGDDAALVGGAVDCVTDPVTEGEVIRELISAGTFKTRHDVARSQGVSRQEISHRVRIQKLPKSILSRLRSSSGHLSLGHARALCSSILSDSERTALARKIELEKLSVRWVEAEVRRRKGQGIPAKTKPTTRSDEQLPQREASNTQDDDPNVRQLQDQLGQAFGCPVKISDGRLVVNYFGNNEILQGIIDQILPPASF